MDKVHRAPAIWVEPLMREVLRECDGWMWRCFLSRRGLDEVMSMMGELACYVHADGFKAGRFVLKIIFEGWTDNMLCNRAFAAFARASTLCAYVLKLIQRVMILISCQSGSLVPLNGNFLGREVLEKYRIESAI